ncbi:unnamed protein product [Merluccius merluccius]
MSGILKRKFEEVEASSSPCSSLRESDEEVSCSESGDSSDSLNPSASGPVIPGSILKREKRLRTRRVHFENVTVYYFGRRQGFTSVPSQGGSTLGMSNTHSWVRQYSLGEFALEQERRHRDMLRDHLKEEKLNSIKLKLTKNGTVESEEANALTVDDISDEDMDPDNTEVDEYFFLQPLTTRKRRALLRSSGVKKIDVEEKHELRAIRMSREDCGCDCRVFCDPETCACSVAGIKCQVDRMSFPCGCTKEGCSNAAGRVEFNPIRVRTHFLHTVMKLELEKSREQQQQQASPGNGYHGENNNGPGNGSALVQSQHGLEYGLSDAPPHLHTPQEMDEQLDDEEEEEDDDDDDDEEEDEEENEEDEEDEEDSSSVCSGISDSSTHSLANSDSEEEEEEEEEEDDEEDEDDEDEDEEKGENFNSRATPSVSHSEMATALCSVAQDGPMNGNGYLLNSSPVEFQLENSSSTKATDSACPPTNPLEREPFTTQDMLGRVNTQDTLGRVNTQDTLGRVNTQDTLGRVNTQDRQQAACSVLAAESYTDDPGPAEQCYAANPHFTLTNVTSAATNGMSAVTNGTSAVLLATGCVSKSDNKITTNGQAQDQIEFQNYLNNSQGSFGSNSSNCSSGHCSVPESAQEGFSVNGRSEIALLADNTKNIPLADHCPEVTAI